ncbi:hypothetical protein B0J18DRAFT_493740 [Chaetomium sp. MPI-SDFR-AT-0129]|nr:hypothetical protein B0J18DRAFT_493740 [Chaetomium sp. MPI-SDFR-AT-0129]
MHLIARSLLFLLPLAAAHTTTASTTSTNPSAVPTNKYASRGFTDKVKGAFGDPVALAKDLPPCMVNCMYPIAIAIRLSDAEACSGKNTTIFDCLCMKPKEGDGKPGALWGNTTQACLADTESAQSSKSELLKSCTEKDYDEGKVLDLCDAVMGESMDKQNETWVAFVDNLEAVKKGNVKKDSEAGVQDGKVSGAVPAPGTLGRVAGLLLVAGLGYIMVLI